MAPKADSAAARLTQWRGKRSKLEASRDLGMHPALLTKIESGEYVPGKKIALRIEAVTRIPHALWWPEAKSAA